MMQWAADILKGSKYEKLFPYGKPTKGWCYGWLERSRFLLGSLMPLEDPRANWFTDENLTTYFEVARDVFINAGVARLNPDYDPNEPFSQEIMITAPKRLCSYDERKMELNCTKASKGNIDRTIGNDPEDDNTAIVTKSHKCGSDVCDRLGDGMALLVIIVFNFGESFKLAWASHYVCDDILDDEGNPLVWRYNSNAKGSVNEECC